MRNIPTALQTHLDGEVITLADCLKIERNDGAVIYLTNHDRDITFGGAIYATGATFNTSAIKTAADLSVDNFQIDVAVDGELIKRVDFDTELYKRARYELFTVNWQAPTDGAIILSRGWIGDVVVRNTAQVTLQMRGLTQALQRNFMQYYSPTCRAQFGDSKCGVPVTPFMVHARRKNYKVGDWALVPTGDTQVALSNNSFEAQGVVANGTSGITDWTHGPSSWWQVVNAPGVDGSYYLRGGDDAGANPAGSGMTMVRNISTSSAGMSAPGVDAGDYIASFSIYTIAPNPAKIDFARLSMRLLDNTGALLKTINGEYFQPTLSWGENSITGFVVPNTRTIQIVLEGVKSSGPVDVGFDAAEFRFWAASTAPYAVAYKVVRIPSYANTDRFLPTNWRFVDTGSVSNGNSGVTGWTQTTSDWWAVVDTDAGLQPYEGAFFLRGGDNGTALGSQEYKLQSSSISLSSLSTSLLTAGKYLGEITVRAANLSDLGSSYRVVVEYLNSSNAVIGTTDSGYQNAGVVTTWKAVRVSSTLPIGTSSVRVSLYARSSVGSSLANVAFDAVEVFVMNTELANTNDAKRGNSAAIRPAFSTAVGAYVYDGDLIWQAQALAFGFDTVANATSRRVFTGTTIAGGQFNFYGAKIIWLTGPNAGTEGVVRTWNPSTKELKTYSPASGQIAGGHKFMYSLGCGKSIADCSVRFNNAINFRGEPYLPGPQKLIKTFTGG